MRSTLPGPALRLSFGARYALLRDRANRRNAIHDHMSSLERIRRLIGLDDTVTICLRPRARAGVARTCAIVSLLALSACGAFADGVEQLDSALFPRCGWHELPVADPTPAPSCRVYVSRLDNCGLLPAGVDPCEAEPAPSLRVEAGQVPGEWYREASPACEFKWVECP